MHIQSHISECCGEVSFVRHLHPEYKTDAAVFDEVGLLTNKVGGGGGRSAHTASCYLK